MKTQKYLQPKQLPKPEKFMSKTIKIAPRQMGTWITLAEFQ